MLLDQPGLTVTLVAREWQHGPSVAVIAVLYQQSESEVERFIQALEELEPRPLGLWVSMNDTTRPSAPGFRASELRVVEVTTGGNVGWTGGVNRAAAAALAAGADRLLIMNTDVDVLRTDMVGRLGDVLARYPDIGAVSPLITFGKCGVDSGTVWYRGGTLCRWAVVTRHPGMGGQVTSSGLVRETDMPSGCTMMVRRETWELVGGFDEELFAYFDEAEWSIRARGFGWKMAVLDMPMVVHHTDEHWGSMTSYLFGRNPVLVARMHYSWFGVVATLLVELLTMPLYLTRAVDGSARRAFLCGLRDGIKSLGMSCRMSATRHLGGKCTGVDPASVSVKTIVKS